MKAVWSLILVALPVFAIASEPTASPVGKKIADFTLRDYRGAERSLAEFKRQKLVVVAFLGCECPVAKLYGARLAELAKEYESKGVAFVGINANQQDGVSAITQYTRAHKIEFPILKDVGNVVADRFRAVKTPEIFVLDPQGVVRYAGRVDNQYGVGYTRPKPEHRDLAAALDELLAGKSVSVARTETQGCFIGRVRKPAKEGTVTYSKQIARILQNRCVDCHHPGAIGPFSLTRYEDAAGWAESIAWVVKEGRMPPWHADPQYGKFVNECRLTDEEKQQIEAWVEGGAPEGDKKDLPKPVEFVEGWRISKPDVVLAMPKPFTVPAKGTIPYQFFAMETGFTEDKWIKAAEVKAGSRSVVHHILVFVQPPNDERPFRGFINDWLASTVPGARPMILPDGLAKRVPAGSRLMFQIHYTPNGSEQLDQSCIGLVFADPKSVKKEVRTDMVLNKDFVIPPGDGNHRVESETVVGRDTILYTFMPHTHLRGKAFKYEAFYPNGDKEILLDVPRYDFNWQNTYVLAEPKRLPKGTKLHCTAYYDNSANNFSNPNPNMEVRWGDQTWQEMMIGYFESAPVEQELLTKPVTPRPGKEPEKLPALDPKLTELAKRAAHSQTTWNDFAAAVKKAVPQVDRVCTTYFIGDKLRVEWSAYPGDLSSRFAETGFERPAMGFGLALHALRGGVTYWPDLKKARGGDFQVMSNTLGSSLHVAVIREDGRPGTLNFWSKDKEAFNAQSQACLRAIADAATGKR